jgi:hypothetical protein
MFKPFRDLLNMPFGVYGSRCMEQIEQLAQAALERDHLKLRSLVQDVIREKVNWSRIPRPSTKDARLLVFSAALVELLAMRNSQAAPAWTKEIGALKESFFARICGRDETTARPLRDTIP